MASVDNPGTSTATASLLSTFSITNESTGGAVLMVNFAPTFLYTLSVDGPSPPALTGFASTTLSNELTGSMFSDMITDGTRSPPLFVGPTVTIANLSPGESSAIVAGFTASAQAREVPEPATILLLATGLIGSSAAVHKRRRFTGVKRINQKSTSSGK
jgi:hypothetical protein